MDEPRRRVLAGHQRDAVGPSGRPSGVDGRPTGRPGGPLNLRAGAATAAPVWCPLPAGARPDDRVDIVVDADNATEAAANLAEEEPTMQPDELVPIIEGMSALLAGLRIAEPRELLLARQPKLPDGGRNPLRNRVPASPPEGPATAGSTPDPTICP